MAVTALGNLIDTFRDLSVLVIGEAMLDAYLYGTSERLCREAPVPIVSVADRRDVPGGAANTAVNARALGATVSLVSVVGADGDGALLTSQLDARDVGTAHVFADAGRTTLAKHRVFAGSQLLVRYDQGTTCRVDPRQEKALVDALAAHVSRHDVVLVSDYGYGILTPRVIATLAACQARAPRVIVADSKTLAAYRAVGVTAIKPNHDEAVRLLGGRNGSRGGDRVDEMMRRGARLLDVTGARIAAVTLDREGALFFERDRPAYRTYARPMEHSRAAGAGDTFMAALGLALGAGADVAGAAEIASAAAAVVVAKDGTAECSGSELIGALSAGDKYARDRRALALRLELDRRAGRRIVLTSGCFDILHRGHITYLNAAKALGDVLVVGVNTDETVRRLKGVERPINGLDDRVQVLAALSAVDHVVAFAEETPAELIRSVRPDIFVKGGDYTVARLPEAPVVEQCGGVVRILPYVDDRSTSSIIQRIRAAA